MNYHGTGLDIKSPCDLTDYTVDQMADQLVKIGRLRASLQQGKAWLSGAGLGGCELAQQIDHMLRDTSRALIELAADAAEGVLYDRVPSVPDDISLALTSTSSLVSLARVVDEVTESLDGLWDGASDSNQQRV